MPILKFSLKDIENLVGRRLPHEPELLNDEFQYVGGEVEFLEGDELHLEIKCRNRPDLWCAEGIARELRGANGKELGLAEYKVEKGDYTVKVNRKLLHIRPYISCAVVKDVKLTSFIIKQIMQMQEKIDGNVGRNRRKTSIGIYNLDLLKFPLDYTVTDLDKNAFVPLNFTKKMTPGKILKEHPKAKEYGHILEGLKQVPIFLDAKGKVLSFPPIINSADLGGISANTRNVLIEVTGTDYETVQNVLKIMSLTFADRGGKIYNTTIDYPYTLPNKKKKDTTPELFSKTVWKVKVADVNKRLGTEFNSNQLSVILQRARYGIRKKTPDFIEVLIPFYRSDIIHVVDIIEDVAINYGYNLFKPMKLDLPTKGGLTPEAAFMDKIRELMIGYGAQEIMTFTLTNDELLRQKVGRKEDGLIRITNPMSSSYEVLRDSLLPMSLDFLAVNKHADYPQNIFEVGECAIFDQSEENTAKISPMLAYCASRDNITFTEVKQVLSSLMDSLGKKFEVRSIEDPLFIEGRVGVIMVKHTPIGLIGEIHPKVLAKFGLEMPVISFEIDLNLLRTV